MYVYMCVYKKVYLRRCFKKNSILIYVRMFGSIIVNDSFFVIERKFFKRRKRDRSKKKKKNRVCVCWGDIAIIEKIS